MIVPTLSPSTIKLWDQDRALFILKSLYGTKSEFSNVHAIRGIAVESGINKNVIECPQRVDNSIALEESLEVFDKLTRKANTDRDVAREFRVSLTGFLTRGGVSLSGIFGGYEGVSSQIGIGFTYNGVNLHGFIDFLKGDTLVDLKCVNKIPSEVTRGERKGHLIGYKKNDVLQVSIYKMALGLEPVLLYVSESDILVHRVTEAEYVEAVSRVDLIINDIKDVFSREHEAILEATVPENFNSIFWDADTIEAAKHIWSKYL